MSERKRSGVAFEVLEKTELETSKKQSCNRTFGSAYFESMLYQSNSDELDAPATRGTNNFEQGDELGGCSGARDYPARSRVDRMTM